MKTLTRRLNILRLGLLKSPWQTCVQLSQLIFPPKGDQTQQQFLEQSLRAVPLILQIETTNACNAACVFCAYPSMQRKKGVMSMELFNKVLDDYAAMGGGPVSLTPVVGDALLDPYFMERLHLLSVYPTVNQVTMTTNAIALERYSDDEVRFLLETMDCIQISVGGLKAETYASLYGVDRLPQVLIAMDRLMGLNEGLGNPAHITIAFRTNDWKFEIRYAQQLDSYRQKGVFVSHISTYANYSGTVKSDPQLNLEVIDTPQKTTTACVYACVHLAVCWDGRVTACGCADFEGKHLCLGQIEESSLAELWRGAKRGHVLESFQNGKLIPLCRQCTAYQPNSIFAQPLFKNVVPGQPLPLHYLQQFWGG